MNVVSRGTLRKARVLTGDVLWSAGATKRNSLVVGRVRHRVRVVGEVGVAIGKVSHGAM